MQEKIDIRRSTAEKPQNQTVDFDFDKDFGQQAWDTLAVAITSKIASGFSKNVEYLDIANDVLFLRRSDKLYAFQRIYDAWKPSREFISSIEKANPELKIRAARALNNHSKHPHIEEIFGTPETKPEVWKHFSDHVAFVFEHATGANAVDVIDEMSFGDYEWYEKNIESLYTAALFEKIKDNLENEKNPLILIKHISFLTRGYNDRMIDIGKSPLTADLVRTVKAKLHEHIQLKFKDYTLPQLLEVFRALSAIFDLSIRSVPVRQPQEKGSLPVSRSY